ncbi:alpha/beta fold hydrolase [Aeromicrobium sp. CF3.5]|uniref:alpha/beta fold hydrolase n=1 Tax=Aeromicrobium sp. CF3.5 TaxID=3373078 RepID=UPI003EE5C2F0
MTHPASWGRQISATIGVGSLDVRVDGPEDGPPIIMLHGFPQTSLSWAAVVPPLVEAGYRVIAPDQRGYSPGARPVGVEHYGYDLLADDVVELADALGLDTFHLVGHDWGAVIAWIAAGRHADRLRSLTAVSVPHLAAFGRALKGSEDQRAMSRYMQLFRIEGKAEDVLLADEGSRITEFYEDKVPADALAEYERLFTDRPTLTAALSYYRAMDKRLNDLPAVTVPTTYVWSTGDRALGREGAEMCGDFVDADYRFVQLQDVTHWIPDEAPDALAEAISDRAARGR